MLKCGISGEYTRQTAVGQFCLSGCVLEDSVLLWTIFWVLRSFIAAVILLGFVFLRYNCSFDLLVGWEKVLSGARCLHF